MSTVLFELFGLIFSLIFGEWYLAVPFVASLIYIIWYFGWGFHKWWTILLFILSLIVGIGIPAFCFFALLLFAGFGRL